MHRLVPVAGSVVLAMAVVGSSVTPGQAMRAGAAGVGSSAVQPPGRERPPVARSADPSQPVGTTVSAAGRTSLDLEATYDVDFNLRWKAARIRVTSTATVRNTSTAVIDRVELNTIAAKLGAIDLDPVTVDGLPVAATISGQTIIVPIGRDLAVGATTVIKVRYRARLRRDLAGSDWMFTRANGIVDLYRWLPWVSRRTPFARPNHGDPFVTPSSPAVTVRITTSRPLVLATTGHRIARSDDGLRQTFQAADVRDFTVTAAPDYRTRSRRVRDHVVRVFYRPGAPAAAMLDAAADAFDAMEHRLGPYRPRVFRVVQSAGGYGMESPNLIWLPTGVARANLRYLAAHETAHQWFYAAVGNDQAREPFVDEAAADLVARFVLGLKRPSRCPAGRLDRTIYDYSAACYYERIYIQGGNLLDRARRMMGSKTFWTALRAYVANNRGQLVSTSTLLDALDGATPIDLGARLFAKRFPRLY
jgi:hypothetical protein